METFITALTSNKLVFTAAVIISILIVLSALRKLVKLALVLLALLVLYSAYLVYTGRKPSVLRPKGERVTMKTEAGWRGGEGHRMVALGESVSPPRRARR